MTDVPADVPALISQWLSSDPDEWTRRVVSRHFDPESGSPYWLRMRASLPFEPLDITRYEQLAEFGPFPLQALRDTDPADFVPLAVPRPLSGRIWETGGTTGEPCRVFYTPALGRHIGAWRQWTLERKGFERGKDWLMASPSGPHIIGELMRLPPDFAARLHGIDMDPRWVKRLLRDGRLREADEYTHHVLDQVAHVLDTRPIDYLYTTPALFSLLITEHPGLVANLGGVWLGGTVITSPMYREFTRALGEGLLGISYGNTFGISNSMPPEADGTLLPYAVCYPYLTISVTEPDDWRQLVPYGEFGRVVLTVLHDDLFLPNILERDQAIRHDFKDRWPWDGVANVRPLQELQSSPEGIY
jgi:hypothetical protein